MICFYINQKQLYSSFIGMLLVLLGSLYGMFHYYQSSDIILGGWHRISTGLLPFGTIIRFPDISTFGFFSFIAGLMLICALFCLKVMFRTKTPVAIVSEFGLLSTYAYCAYYPLILWRDITRLTIIHMHGQKYIGIALDTSSDFFNELSFGQKIACSWNYKLYDAHVTIGNLDRSLQEVFDIIENHIKSSN